MASLLTTGRQIKGSAMAGLTSAARSEAQTNIAEEQLEQAKKAQQAQLLGTGLGIGGAYMITQGAGGAAAAAGGALASPVAGGAAGAAAAANPAAAAMGLQTGTAAAGAAGAGAGAGAAGAGAAGAGAGAGAAGGATALLANPMTWAVVAGLYLLKKVF